MESTRLYEHHEEIPAGCIYQPLFLYLFFEIIGVRGSNDYTGSMSNGLMGQVNITGLQLI